jgi:hypothetical protein
VHLNLKEDEVDAQKWEEARRQVEEELEKAKQRALLAESFDELEDIVVEMGRSLGHQPPL